MQKRNRLGILPGYHSSHVDVDKIQSDIQTKFPQLWQMLELHPVKHLKIVTNDIMTTLDPDNDSKDSSGMYNYPTTTIYLNWGAFDIINAKGPRGFNEWTTAPEIGVPTLSQVSREDFYTILTVHELGHHFQQFLLDDRGLFRTATNSFAQHAAMWRLIDMLGVPPKDVAQVLVEGTGMSSPAEVRPVVSRYAAGEAPEYFAEDFAAYWYFPKDLQLIDSVAYGVIEKVIAKVLASKGELVSA